jgi:ABC-type uncharacterized transport system involved in gliding motility auxiliary subunit
MNWKTTILGLSALIALCGAIAIQVLDMNQVITSVGWALTGALFLAWSLFNRVPLKNFLMHKSTRYGANMALVIFLILGILVFLNVLAKDHPWRKDVTRTGTNTLSEQSQKIVKGLTQDVKAYFFTASAEKDKGEDLLKRYSYLSKHFTYEFVDVERKPTQAAAMGVKRKGVVVLTLGENKKVSVDQPTEENLTNGLIKLLRSNEVSVYFTTGHEEHPLDGDKDPLGFSNLKGELTKQGYTVKELNLFSEGKIPADAALVVVGGPKKTFFPKELEILGAWIKDGGHALLAMDLDVAESGLGKGSRQIADLLKPYGVQVMNQMLVDPTSKVANVEPQVLLGFSGSKEHAITKDFAHSASVANFLFPLTTYMVRDEKAPTEITPLVNTTAQAWAESDWASLKKGSASYDPATDHQGRMDLGYAIEGRKPEGQNQPSARAVKIVAFADAVFATNNLIDKVSNRDLVLNSIAWLADEGRFISIRPNEDPDALKQYNNSVLNFILLLTVFFIPLILIGVGTVVWWRRSKL